MAKLIAIIIFIPPLLLYIRWTRRKRVEQHMLQLASESARCQLCGASEGLAMKGWDSNSYSCETCGFDTIMKRHEGAAELFMALDAADGALTAFEEAQRIANQHRGFGYISERDRGYPMRELSDGHDAQLRGMEWLDRLVRDTEHAHQMPMLDSDTDIASEIFELLGELGAQIKEDGDSAPPAPADLEKEARAGIRLSQRARETLVHAIREKLKLKKPVQSLPSI